MLKFHRVAGGAEEVEAGFKEAPEVVGVAVTEKAKWLDAVVVNGELALQRRHIQFVVVSIDKGSDKLAFVKKVNRLWRRMDKPGVSGMQVIRSDPFGERGNEIKKQQDDARDQRQFVAPQFPPHQPPLGSQI